MSNGISLLVLTGTVAVSGAPLLSLSPPSFLFRRTLADIIMEKLTEKQTEVETVMSEVSGFPMPQLDPRVLEVYRGVREVTLGTFVGAVGSSLRLCNRHPHLAGE